ncbi:hypothetical protein [Alcanivorax sp. 24]|uniref:hypothetical protein n=1 Tax=Alcanivorax sp. 24 TaxID=2545266 RepID=UPI00105FDCD1|nr:hypothetical protein [Alcanivorax sp. 24]
MLVKTRFGSLISTVTVTLAISSLGTMSGCASNDDASGRQALVGSSDVSGPSNMFGGPSYQGEPALVVTATLVRAGGGAEEFSFAKALVTMLGEEIVNAEVAKLIQQYGQEEVDIFIGGMDLAVNLSLKHATQAGITLPAPAELNGIELAETLVSAGTAPDGTFWSGYLFDKAVSNGIHHQVMVDINSSVGYEADLITHKILNQAMYDVAQVLGMKQVKLAGLH